ncbi:MAG: hypothetical protein JOZ41_12265 [Chloroflexi bacterium]|nr:hypothetical protein [Chloroflexota bacterium]
MKLLLPVAILAVLLSSCRQQPEPVSPLQRLDALAPQLRVVTDDSAAVAADVGRLSGAMRRADAALARRLAVRLKLDAGAFARVAGRVGNAVRPLVRAVPRGAARTYTALTLQGLVSDWFEGRTLIQLSEAVWFDPDVMTVPDEQRLAKLSARAGWYAWMAVRSARQAAWWRWRYGQDFRYVPVTGGGR